VYGTSRRPVAVADRRVTPLVLDVSDLAQIQDAVARVGSLDVVINNAGVSVPDDLSDRSAFEPHLAVNLYGTLDVTGAFLPALIRSHGAVGQHRVARRGCRGAGSSGLFGLQGGVVVAHPVAARASGRPRRAPALRIGWLVVPRALLEAVVREKVLADRGTARIEQQAFADFLSGGELDRHLRRMRARYRARRDAMIDALANALPEATVSGVAAGLHVTVRLPDGDDEQAIREHALLRRIEVEPMSDFRPHGVDRPPALVLGYAQLPEPAIRAGVRALSEAVRASRSASRAQGPRQGSAAR
jgi:NAD(P)-dependent dehydrogenase (short-subunit alcohol dehydrogenase family)